MSDLSKKKCVACDGNTLPFDITEIHKYLKKVDGWLVKCDEKKSFYLIKSLGHKIYQFWFEEKADYEDFRANILAYKMSSTKIKDDK